MSLVPTHGIASRRMLFRRGNASFCSRYEETGTPPPTAVDIDLSRASGAAKLGSCLTDVTRRAAPGVSFVYSPLCWRPNVCDSNRRGTLTRWNHAASVPDCKYILKLCRGICQGRLKGYSSTTSPVRAGPERRPSNLDALRSNHRMIFVYGFAKSERDNTKLVCDRQRGAKRPSVPSPQLLALVRTKGLDTIA